VNYQVAGQIGQITDRDGISGLQITTEIILTRGLTIWNFTDVRVGTKIIVPEVRRMYEKNYKKRKTGIKEYNKIKFGKTNTNPTHWYIWGTVHFLHNWYILFYKIEREEKDCMKIVK
jgi:hypothetical protein